MVEIWEEAGHSLEGYMAWNLNKSNLLIFIYNLCIVTLSIENMYGQDNFC